MTISAVGRHVEIDGDAFHRADRLAGERAGDAHLVHVDGELLRAGEGDDRRAADHDRDRHRRLQLAMLQPVLVAAGAADARGHAHAEPVGGFEPGAVGAHVLDAALRVLGDAERGGEIGRGVEAGRRDRHRQELQSAVGLLQLVALDDDLLARRGRRRAPARSDARRRRSRPGRSPRPACPCRWRRSAGLADSAPTTTGMSYFLPLPSTTLVNRNARRLSSGRPPTNCQRTSGCSSVSLSIGRSMRVTSPAASSAARCCWKSSAGPLVFAGAPRLSG